MRSYLDTHEANCDIIAAAVLNGELDVSDHTAEKVCPVCGARFLPYHGGQLDCRACYNDRRRPIDRERYHRRMARLRAVACQDQ